MVKPSMLFLFHSMDYGLWTMDYGLWTTSSPFQILQPQVSFF